LEDEEGNDMSEYEEYFATVCDHDSVSEVGVVDTYSI
jgi:hypothetical protein